MENRLRLCLLSGSKKKQKNETGKVRYPKRLRRSCANISSHSMWCAEPQIYFKNYMNYCYKLQN